MGKILSDKLPKRGIDELPNGPTVFSRPASLPPTKRSTGHAVHIRRVARRHRQHLSGEEKTMPGTYVGHNPEIGKRYANSSTISIVAFKRSSPASSGNTEDAKAAEAPVDPMQPGIDALEKRRAK